MHKGIRSLWPPTRTATYKNGQFSGHYGHLQLVIMATFSELLWPPPQKGDIWQVIINKDLGERDGQTYMNSVT